MTQHTQSLTELSRIIADNTRIIEEFLSTSANLQLSDDVNAPARFPVEPHHVEIHEARRTAMAAAKKVHDRLWGAEERFLAQATPVSRAFCAANIDQSFKPHRAASLSLSVMADKE